MRHASHEASCGICTKLVALDSPPVFENELWHVRPLDPPGGCVFHPRCPLAGPRCSIEVPRLQNDAGGLVACHLYDGGVALKTAA